jgi:hypothetical protein
LKPRASKVSIPLPENDELPTDVVKTLSQLPPLNNLRMFARVPRCFNILVTFIDQIFNHGTFDNRLRECMYVRISYICGLYYEFRHNVLFSEHLGMTEQEIKALTCEGEVRDLDPDANLVCKAAEEITRNISISDAILERLITRFGIDDTAEIVLLVSWFNMLVRYVESMRVPYEENLEKLNTGSRPLALKTNK